MDVYGHETGWGNLSFRQTQPNSTQTYWLSMTTTSLWDKNEAGKLLSDCWEQKWFTQRHGWSQQSGKTRWLLLLGEILINYKLFNGRQIGWWWATWKACHIRRISWHQGFCFWGITCKRGAWEMMPYKDRTEQGTPSGTVWINMNKNLFWAWETLKMKYTSLKNSIIRSKTAVTIYKDVNLEIWALTPRTNKVSLDLNIPWIWKAHWMNIWITTFQSWRNMWEAIYSLHLLT